MIHPNSANVLLMASIVVAALVFGSACQKEVAAPELGTPVTLDVPPDLRDIPFVNVTDYGADNTGQNDSRAAIQSAIDTGKSLFFPAGSYRIDGTVSFRATNAYYYFNHARVFGGVHPIIYFDITGQNLTFHGFIIDGLGLPAAGFAVRLLPGASGIHLRDCAVAGLRGTEATTQQYAVWVDLENVRDFVIEGCTFENISQIGDGEIAYRGFAGGLYFVSTNPNITLASNGVVSSCTFRNIYTEQAPGEPLDPDGDAVRFYYEYPDLDGPTQNLNIVLTGNNFIDCQKRAFKVSGVGGILIGDSHVFSSRTDVMMLAAVTVQGGAHHLRIDNLYAKGSIEKGIWVTDGSSVTINGLYVEATDDAEICGTAGAAVDVHSTAGADLQKITITNVTAKNMKGILLQDAHDCYCANVNVINSCNVGTSDLFAFYRCADVDVVGLQNASSGAPDERVLYVEDCRGLSLREVSLRGVGREDEAVAAIWETSGGICERIEITDFVIEQTGYAEGMTGAQTVSVRSANNGIEDENSVDAVTLEDGRILIAQQPGGFTASDSYGLLLESRHAEVADVRIEYLGDHFERFSSMMFVTNCDYASLRGLSFVSSAKARTVYCLATWGLLATGLYVDIPQSWIQNDASCGNLVFDWIYARHGFDTQIDHVVNVPNIVVFDPNIAGVPEMP
jgi:hypothetical protein